ncbi:MAG: CPBP family intramembrane glutamic endopeptidase [Anaerolineales bacterium]|nr:CPBP family intramembrane glutamic endopeptidase [Anaerolineales bacterium]
MNKHLDVRRILIFTALAFGLSWLVGLIIYQRGGLAGSPEIIPGVSEAVLLVGGLYMFGPAFAHLVTRLVTREGWQDMGLRPHFKRSWRYWLIAWFGTFFLVLSGAAIYFILSPQQIDPELGAVREMMGSMGAEMPFSPGAFLVVQLVLGGLLAPFIPINILAMFGEEFGWRGYLQPRLMPLGRRKAMVLMGLIWSVWHWPLLLMGHAYGPDYPGAPWLGLLAFTWFTFVVGTYLGWLTVRSGSLWPAVIGHAVHNGIATASTLLLLGQPNPVLGPTTGGLIGGLAFSLVACWLLWKGDWRGPEVIPGKIPAQKRNPISPLNVPIYRKR